MSMVGRVGCLPGLNRASAHIMLSCQRSGPQRAAKCKYATYRTDTHLAVPLLPPTSTSFPLTLPLHAYHGK